MTTINNINAIFRSIGANHLQINETSVIKDYDIAASEKVNHVLLAVYPIGAGTPKTDNGYTSITIEYSLKVVDLIAKDKSNQQEVLSDTLSIIGDVIKLLNQHPDYMELSLNIIDNITFNPLDGVLDTDVTGWETSFTFEQPFSRGYCNVPTT
jgi:hypothetical protein